MIDSSQSTSTRPYLLRALYEWCADNSLTPYIAAYVDESVKVPREYVKNNEIVLNISMDATSHLKIDNESVRFKARFGGVAREIVVPMDHVIAIYARENGQGMAFPVPQSVPPRGEVQPPPKASSLAAAPAGTALRPVVNKAGLADSAGEMQAEAPPLKPASLKPSAVKPAAVPKGYEPTQKIVPLKPSNPATAAAPTDPNPSPPSGSPRPSLTRIK